MAADLNHIPAFEAEVAALASQLEAILTQVELIRVQRWPNDTGEDQEGVWNSTPDTPGFLPGTSPVAKINQGKMNNFMSTLSAVRTALLDGRANIAKVAAYAPGRLNNS